MEATCSSETSADFQRTAWNYMSEDKTFHNHRSENLKSYMNLLYRNSTLKNSINFAYIYCDVTAESRNSGARDRRPLMSNGYVNISFRYNERVAAR
jgi:hypothetical protein